MLARLSRAFRCVSLVFLVIAWPARAESPEDEEGAPVVRTGYPARFEIVTAEGVATYRTPVRIFATTVQREFHSTLGFPFPEAGTPPIRIEVGFPRPFAMDVTHRIFKLPSGQVRGVVAIPNPPTADYDSIRLAIVATIFQTALYSRAKDVKQVTQPPAWFLRGLALHSDPGGRIRLFESAYSFWSHANLPSFQALFSTNSIALANPPIAAQIAAWCVADHDELEKRWDTLLDYLARGADWNATLLGFVFRDSDSLPDLDDDFNLWLAGRTNYILDIGATSPTALLRLRSQLLIYPWESDIDYLLPKFPAKGIPLTACFAHADLPEVQAALQEHMQRFHLMAIGRDPLFQALCGQYSLAIQKALKPGHEDGALRLWKEAENSRMDLETRLATGEILK